MKCIFASAESFSRDISTWCVERTDAKPHRFDYEAAGFDTETDKQPNCGTDCPGIFRITDLQLPAQADPGESLSLTATITNNGAEPDTQAVAFKFDGSVATDRNISLDDGASTTIEFTS